MQTKKVRTRKSDVNKSDVNKSDVNKSDVNKSEWNTKYSLYLDSLRKIYYGVSVIQTQIVRVEGKNADHRLYMARIVTLYLVLCSLHFSSSPSEPTGSS